MLSKSAWKSLILAAPFVLASCAAQDQASLQSEDFDRRVAAGQFNPDEVGWVATKRLGRVHSPVKY